MSDERTTEPTLVTVLDELRSFRASVEKRLDIVESQLVHMDARNDRFESIMLTLRADFKEFRAQFKEPA
jgi:hypothetical protein